VGTMARQSKRAKQVTLTEVLVGVRVRRDRQNYATCILPGSQFDSLDSLNAWVALQYPVSHEFTPSQSIQGHFVTKLFRR
jgi:hypothetical protein